ncbi:MAG: GatB/YqeY domain-containing protein [Lentimicrobiaceae bacterium]|nr:GatB/YqeY domain-containing protein [Lentimicrobiaceae bacterium]
MSLEQRINEDIKAAMLAKEKEKLNALRAVKAAILLLKTSEGNVEITEEIEINLLQKLAKQRRDAAELYKNQNREDLYQEEIEQLEFISQYLPEQLSEEDIANVLQTLIAENNLSGMKDMGKLMGLASKKMAGKADNKIISEIVKKILQP